MRRPEVASLPSDFVDQWAAWYPDAPPIGFLLREAYEHRWLRIHSLPESKRYPKSGWEYAEVVRRHNVVANDVLGVGAPCAALIYRGCNDRWSDRLGRVSGLGEEPLPRVAPLPPELHDEDEGIFEVPMCIFGVATRWQPGSFDAFISATADNKVRGLLVELRRGQVYAPYDGGADLIFATEVERDAAHQRYAAWLSSDPSGL
jgi:hypothetical protein